MNTKLILVRHGITDWNLEHRFQGQTDIPLNQYGFKQAGSIGKHLQNEKLDFIYCSDLQRAKDTAKEVSKYHTCKLIPDQRLRELDFGQWEGLTYKEIQEKDGKYLSTWNENKLIVPPPEGESLGAFADRIEYFLEDISKNKTDKTVSVVAHGGTIKVLICLVLGLSPLSYWQFSIDQASLSQIMLLPEGAVVDYMNDTSFLK